MTTKLGNTLPTGETIINAYSNLAVSKTALDEYIRISREFDIAADEIFSKIMDAALLGTEVNADAIDPVDCVDYVHKVLQRVALDNNGFGGLFQNKIDLEESTIALIESVRGRKATARITDTGNAAIWLVKSGNLGTPLERTSPVDVCKGTIYGFTLDSGLLLNPSISFMDGLFGRRPAGIFYKVLPVSTEGEPLVEIDIQ